MNYSQIRQSITRYQALRRHRDADFDRRQQHLEQWKRHRMQICYQPLLQDPHHEAMLSYYFNRIFSGLDLSELQDAEATINIIEQFFSGTDMLQAALEFNALTGEINQALTQTLFEEMQYRVIDEEGFLLACEAIELWPQMEAQLIQFERFAEGLNFTLANKKVITAIKLAKFPAKIAGFGQLYQLVADGLAVVKNIADPEHIAAQLIAHERLLLNRQRQQLRPAILPLQALL